MMSTSYVVAALAAATVLCTSPALATSSSATSRGLIEAMTPVISPTISQYALQGGEEFANPDSYQSRALDRVAQQVGVASMTDAKLVQYYALYCIFEATNAQPNFLTYSDKRFSVFVAETFPGWSISTGWKSNELDPCDGWYGIECEDDMVTVVKIIQNRLTGFFPPEIKLLAGDGPYSTGAGNLNYLELYGNEFLFNNFDNSWMSDLGSNLEYLFVGFTGFSGWMPTLPPGVLEIDFAYTLIHKGFDDSVFADATLLEYANFGGNNFNTTIPSALASLPNLRFLYFVQCELRDTDMSFLEHMPSIYELWIDGNPNFTGSIPSSIGDKTTLASLSLTENGLTGPIPSEMGLLVEMQQMWLYDNALTGEVPSELGAIPRMKIFEVTGNALAGTMPSEVCGNTGYFGLLDTLGADCDIVDCPCCTCCSLSECQPSLYPETPAPYATPVYELTWTGPTP